MKKIAIIAALSLAALTIVAPTQASAAVKCTPTKAVAHQPLKTNPPQTVAKKLPTTLTLVTNCGTIVATLDPKAPHYADQTPLFAAERFKPVLFTEAQLAGNVVETYRPGFRAH